MTDHYAAQQFTRLLRIDDHGLVPLPLLLAPAARFGEGMIGVATATEANLGGRELALVNSTPGLPDRRLGEDSLPSEQSR